METPTEKRQLNPQIRAKLEADRLKNGTLGTRGTRAIEIERIRQIADLNFSIEHDKALRTTTELISAAMGYLHLVRDNSCASTVAPGYWPSSIPFKPGTRLRTLVKAGALTAAAIDRELAVQGHTTDTEEETEFLNNAAHVPKPMSPPEMARMIAMEKDFAKSAGSAVPAALSTLSKITKLVALERTFEETIKMTVEIRNGKPGAIKLAQARATLNNHTVSVSANALGRFINALDEFQAEIDRS
jgi:hypothetical protein